MSERGLLAVIIFTFMLLGGYYAISTPVFEASDELWHYPMVQHLENGNELPVQDPDNVGPWKQEASQPPLYYYIGAALTFWIDTTDMEQVRQLNPHVDNGVITADGNINLAVHDPDLSPWRGTLLAVRIIRLASVLMSTVTVYLTYMIAKLTVPNRPFVALGAAALNAFTPMFLFISGAVNNDNLAVMLTSLGLYLMIRVIKIATNHEQTTADDQRSTTSDQHPTISPIKNKGMWIELGIIVGLGALTKQGTLALFPLAWGTAFVAEWIAGGRASNLPALLRAFLQSWARYVWVLMPAYLIAGWWYIRNIQLYGDLLGWSAFFEVLGVRATPASLAQLWDERWGFMLSYWGLFGGVNVPMATWIYHVMNGVAVVGVLGFLVYFGRLLFVSFPRMNSGSETENRLKPVESGLFARIAGNIMTFVVEYFGLVVCLLLTTAVVYGLIQWATNTWSSQGRLVFTAMSAICTLLAIGLIGAVPKRLSPPAFGVVFIFFFTISSLAPSIWIKPAYAVNNDAQLVDGTSVNANFGDQIRLVGYRYRPNSLSPDSELDIWLTWQVIEPMENDWSVFIHLTDPVIGVPIAQRDMYHRQGLRPTSLLNAGISFTDYYRIHIPPTAIAPTELDLNVGLYDYETNERLKLTSGEEFANLTTIPLTTPNGTLPNPTSVNFGDEITLVGYSVAPRRATTNDTINLTLYWQPNQPLTTDYTFFAQVIGEENKRWGAIDKGGVGTLDWQMGEVYTVEMPLVLDAEMPADVFPIIIGAYHRPNNTEFVNLQIVTPDGRITQDNFLTLTQIRIER